jgi:HSP20 family protein
MSLIPWRSKRRESGPEESSPLATLREEMDRLFDAFVREPLGTIDWPFGGHGRWSPTVDIAESDEEVTVRAEIPGIDPESLDVSISGNQLVLAGEKR